MLVTPSPTLYLSLHCHSRRITHCSSRALSTHNHRSARGARCGRQNGDEGAQRAEDVKLKAVNEHLTDELEETQRTLQEMKEAWEAEEKRRHEEEQKRIEAERLLSEGANQGLSDRDARRREEEARRKAELEALQRQQADEEELRQLRKRVSDLTLKSDLEREFPQLTSADEEELRELRQRVTELSQLSDRAWRGRRDAEDALRAVQLELETAKQNRELTSSTPAEFELKRRVNELLQLVGLEQQRRTYAEDAQRRAEEAMRRVLPQEHALKRQLAELSDLLDQERSSRQAADDALEHAESTAGQLAFQLKDERVASIATAHMRVANGEIPVPRHTSPNARIRQAQIAHELQMAAESVPVPRRISPGRPQPRRMEIVELPSAQADGRKLLGDDARELNKKLIEAEAKRKEAETWVAQAEAQIKVIFMVACCCDKC